MTKKILAFGAPNCSGCRTMEPFLAQAQCMGVEIEHVDVTQQGELAGQYGVQSLPTFVFVEEGAQPWSMAGASATTIRAIENFAGMM